MANVTTIAATILSEWSTMTHDNASENNSLAADLSFRASFDFQVILALTMMSIITLMAICGNLAVFSVIITTQHLRENLTYLFVLNLCTVDFLSAVTVLPMAMVSYALDQWVFGPIVCQLNGFLNSFFVFASILSICVISIERFYSIKLPMKYAANMTLSRTACIMTYIWLQSLFLALMPLIGWNAYEYRQHKAICSITWGMEGYHKVYIVFIGLIGFVIPGLIMFLMYIGIYKVAQKTARQVHPAIVPTTNVVVTAPDDQNSTSAESTSPTVKIFPLGSLNSVENGVQKLASPSGYDNQTTSRKFKGHWRAIRTLACIIVMFMILWGPHFILNIHGALNGISSTSEVAEIITTWLAFSSFAVNPLLYGWLNRSIRDELSDILYKCRLCLCKHEDEHAMMGLGGAEDFYQFLERTSATRHPSCPNTKAPTAERSAPIIEESESCQFAHEDVNKNCDSKF